jgi:hypothetical protein
MAEPRSRRSEEHNQDLTKLLADSAMMRQRLEALEKRVIKLEAELAAARKSPTPRPSKRPPPLPLVDVPVGLPARMPPIPKSSGPKGVVDISEIAELVDSVPPPRSRK